MNYLILIVVGLVGIALGMYFARRGKGDLISEQAKQKAENKQKILSFVQEHEKIQNNDVEKLAGVSNATAERYGVPPFLQTLTLYDTLCGTCA